MLEQVLNRIATDDSIIHHPFSDVDQTGKIIEIRSSSR